MIRDFVTSERNRRRWFRSDESIVWCMGLGKFKTSGSSGELSAVVEVQRKTERTLVTEKYFQQILQLSIVLKVTDHSQ
jgi:hypothetical protein